MFDPSGQGPAALLAMPGDLSGDRPVTARPPAAREGVSNRAAATFDSGWVTPATPDTATVAAFRERIWTPTPAEQAHYDQRAAARRESIARSCPPPECLRGAARPRTGGTW